MSDFQMFLSKYELSYKINDYLKRVIVLSDHDSEFSFEFEKQQEENYKYPNYFLRVMSRRTNFFSIIEEEKEFYHLAFLFLKEYAEKNLSYNYIFIDKLFIRDEVLKEKYKLETRFHHLLTYGHNSYFQMKSSLCSNDIDSYTIVREEVFKLLEREIKVDPRIDYRVTSTDTLRIYTPDVEMKVSFQFMDGKTEIKVERYKTRDKVIFIGNTLDRKEIQDILSVWFKKLYGENRLKLLFNSGRKPLYNQSHLREKNMKMMDLKYVLAGLKELHTNDEVEKMAGELRRSGKFILQNDMLNEAIFLVTVRDYFFICDTNGKPLKIFDTKNKEEAKTTFQNFIVEKLQQELKSKEESLMEFLS